MTKKASRASRSFVRHSTARAYLAPYFSTKTSIATSAFARSRWVRTSRLFERSNRMRGRACRPGLAAVQMEIRPAFLIRVSFKGAHRTRCDGITLGSELLPRCGAPRGGPLHQGAPAGEAVL